MSMSSEESSNIQETIDWTGKVLNNKYIAIKRIGKGAFATVWLSFDMDKNRMVAIKIHNTHDYVDGEQDAQLLKSLKKQKIKCITDFIETFDILADDEYVDEEDGEDMHLCIVMELMGCSLADLLKEGKYKKGLPVDAVEKIYSQIKFAITELNNIGYVHTDIKPENILLEGISKKNNEIKNLFTNKFDYVLNNTKKELIKKKFSIKKIRNEAIKLTVKKLLEDIDTDSDTDSDSDSEYEYNKEDLNTTTDSEDGKDCNYCCIDDKYINNINVKLSDFGTCIKKNKLDTFSIQTRYYRAPEIILHMKYDEKCDMWSLGCTLFELLTGKMLFDPDDYVDEGCNIDERHLQLIQGVCGKIPNEILDKCERACKYFKKDGSFKGGKIKIIDIPESPLKKTILKCLSYYPDKR